MPYPPSHKPRTRQRILRSAATLFATRGFEATTIDDVMRACGLTRGAFYAHFRSKAQLHQEAMRAAGEAQAPRDPRLAEGWADEVLGPLEASGSRTSALSGRWAFLAADVASASPAARRAWEAAVRQLMAAAARPGAVGDETVEAVALLLGTLAVACTVEDDALRQAYLRVCRQRLDAAPPRAEDGDVLWGA